MEQGLLVSCLEAADLDQALKMTADIGYRHCEISGCPDDSRPNLASLGVAARKDTIARATELGMSVSAVQCHIHEGYADRRPSVRQAAVDHTRGMIDMCADLAIPVCHTVSGVADDKTHMEKHLDHVAAAMEAVLDHAKDTPVKVGFEPVFVYVVGSLAETRALLERLDEREDLYINYDPSHFPYREEPAEDYIRALGGRIIHAHSKDAVVAPVTPNAMPDEKDRFAMPGNRYFKFTPPGQGVLNWDLIVDALKDVGFDGVISLEMGHGYEGPPVGIAGDVYRFFRDKYGIE